MNLWLKVKRAAREGRGLLLSQEDVSELYEVTSDFVMVAEEAAVERRRAQWREGEEEGTGLDPLGERR